MDLGTFGCSALVCKVFYKMIFSHEKHTLKATASPSATSCMPSVVSAGLVGGSVEACILALLYLEALFILVYLGALFKIIIMIRT